MFRNQFLLLSLMIGCTTSFDEKGDNPDVNEPEANEPSEPEANEPSEPEASEPGDEFIDNDNDGMVSYAEYTNFMRKIDAAVDEKTNSAHFMNPDQNWKRHQKGLGFEEYHKRFHSGKWTAGGDMEQLRPESHAASHRGSLHNETNLHGQLRSQRSTCQTARD